MSSGKLSWEDSYESSGRLRLTEAKINHGLDGGKHAIISDPTRRSDPTYLPLGALGLKLLPHKPIM